MCSRENFYPFLYGRVNPPTFSRRNSPKTYYDMSIGSLDYPSSYKTGEINLNQKPYKNYDEYLNKLHNSHLNEPVSRYNNSCSCQKVDN